jgi:hypothetical protein
VEVQLSRRNAPVRRALRLYAVEPGGYLCLMQFSCPSLIYLRLVTSSIDRIYIYYLLSILSMHATPLYRAPNVN